MKNIHLRPTNKPSRLWKMHNKSQGLMILDTASILDGNPQHLYITNNEEIKNGCYAYQEIFGVGKVSNIYGVECFVNIKTSDSDGLITTTWKTNIPEIKKIILTTDQDLIADGVQAIDEGFLEWFIKDPSCESVEVVKEPFLIKGEPDYFNYDDGTKLNPKVGMYKIIIPKARVGVIGKNIGHVTGILPIKNGSGERVGKVFVTTINEDPIRDSIYKKEYLDMSKNGFSMNDFNWTPSHQDFVGKYTPQPSTWNEPNEEMQVPNVTPDEEHQRKATIVNTLIVNAFGLDDEAFGWLMDKLNQRKVKSKMLEGILEEMLDREQEIIYDVKRFNGVSTSHIKRVFEKYGIVNEDKF